MCVLRSEVVESSTGRALYSWHLRAASSETCSLKENKVLRLVRHLKIRVDMEEENFRPPIDSEARYGDTNFSQHEFQDA